MVYWLAYLGGSMLSGFGCRDIYNFAWMLFLHQHIASLPQRRALDGFNAFIQEILVFHSDDAQIELLITKSYLIQLISRNLFWLTVGLLLDKPLEKYPKVIKYQLDISLCKAPGLV